MEEEKPNSEDQQQSVAPKEYDDDAIYHWGSLLPTEFFKYLESHDLLNDTPEVVLGELEGETIQPRDIVDFRMREGLERIKKIKQILDEDLYTGTENIYIEDCIQGLEIPDALRQELQRIFREQTSVKTLLDVYILGHEGLDPRRFREDTFSSEAFRHLYETYILPQLIENAIQDDEENEKSDEEGGVHHHHYPKKGIGFFKLVVCSTVLTLIAQERGYIDIHKQPIRHDIKATVSVIKGYIHQIFGRN